jgi:putative SOS response-associated peptidase YedK
VRQSDSSYWSKETATKRPAIDPLRPFQAEEMAAWKVDKAVGNVKNDAPEPIERASTTPKEFPGSLFL